MTASMSPKRRCEKSPSSVYFGPFCLKLVIGVGLFMMGKEQTFEDIEHGENK